MEETTQTPNKKRRHDHHENDSLTTEDKISTLPDILLTNILSRLQHHHLRNAAATSVLSHRWRYLWTQLDCLIFSYYTTQSPKKDHKDLKSFLSHIDHILLQLTSPTIRVFHLESPCPQYGDETVLFAFYLASWVPLICSRNPHEFQVTLDKTLYPASSIPFNLSCVFQCPSLVKLKLVGRFSCTVPTTDRFSVCLPNLRHLELENLAIDFISDWSYIPFISSRLEFLKLGLESPLEVIFHLSAHNLVSLTVTVLKQYGPRYFRFVIDAPKLEDICLQGCFAVYKFVGEPREPFSANIGRNFWGRGYGQEIRYRSGVAELFEGISDVGKLHLHGNNLAMFNVCAHSHAHVLQLFRNLTSLTLEDICTKTFNGQQPPFPACLLTRVKLIEVFDLKGDKNGLNLLEYVLCNAIALEELRVDGNFGEDEFMKDEMWREYKFCKDLFEFPRSSSACKIMFDGRFIHASSKDYQDDDGSLTCRITDY